MGKTTSTTRKNKAAAAAATNHNDSNEQEETTIQMTAQERRARRKAILTQKRRARRGGRSTQTAKHPRDDNKTTVADKMEIMNDECIEIAQKLTPPPPENLSAVAASPDNDDDATLLVAVQPEPTSVLIAPPTWQGLPQRKKVTRPMPLESSSIDQKQQQQVDVAFQNMFGYTWGTKFAWNQPSKNEDDDDEPTNKKKAKQKTQSRIDTEPSSKKAPDVLCRVLGPSRAARILRLQENSNRNHGSRATTQEQQPRNMYTTTRIKTIQRAAVPLKSCLPALMTRISSTSIGSTSIGSTSSTIVNDKKRAPQVATVTRSTRQRRKQPQSEAMEIDPLVATTTTTGSGGGGGGGGGVDDLLKKLNETGKVSTITKTAQDWESFKAADSGLAASLEEHTESKGAFLKKRDFLERVDHRKFQHERKVRERERSKKK